MAIISQVPGSGTPATNSVIGVIVPVKAPGAEKVKPVMKAEPLVGSSPAEVSMPVTVKADTPPEAKKNWLSWASVVLWLPLPSV